MPYIKAGSAATVNGAYPQGAAVRKHGVMGRVCGAASSLVCCEADIVDPSGTLVAKAPATYQVG